MICVAPPWTRESIRSSVDCIDCPGYRARGIRPDEMAVIHPSVWAAQHLSAALFLYSFFVSTDWELSDKSIMHMESEVP